MTANSATLKLTHLCSKMPRASCVASGQSPNLSEASALSSIRWELTVLPSHRLVMQVERTVDTKAGHLASSQKTPRKVLKTWQMLFHSIRAKRAGRTRSGTHGCACLMCVRVFSRRRSCYQARVQPALQIQVRFCLTSWQPL